ncbi:MAG: cysteine hydrolase family protein, partial [Gemmatimonadetes bacterium]|nr:cysteine hydrolase family protein [Gemmatimonadota bacterium]
FVERSLPLSTEQTALVLVDVWATHYIDSWLQRAAEITRQKIVPLIEALRAAGVTIIHAPSPFVVERHHPDCMPAPRSQSPDAPDADSSTDWPPAAFHGLYRGGEHAVFGRDPEPRLDAALARYETELRISPLAQPEAGDVVIATGEQLHEELRSRQILHLLYAGFATNWCVIGRDYGMIAMHGRGYNNILVRDATTGVEFHDSVQNLTATKMSIREIETKYGWSATSEDLIQAAQAITI